MAQADAQSTLDGVFGKPVTITSGLRTPAHNAAVGGVPNSDHLNPDGAYDFVVPGLTTAQAAAQLKASGVGSRVILDEGSHVHWSTGGSVTPADDALPSPDQVMKGYGAAPAAGVPAATPAAATDPDALPDPRDVMGGYKSQAPGSGAVTSGSDKKPINAAQEATFQRLVAAGKINMAAPVGSDALPWPERPDIPTPAGAAHIDPYGVLVPAVSAKPAAAPAAPEVPAGQGNPASNFIGDWAARAAEGNAAIHASLDAAQHPTVTDAVIKGMGLPTLNDMKGAGGVLGVASAPIMSAFDQVVGRPLGAVANAANAITGAAPGYQADPRKISDIASVAAPFGEAAAANRAIAAGAKAAGMSESAYVAARAADAAAAPVIAQLNTAPKPPNGVLNAVTSNAAPYMAGLSQGEAEKQGGQFLATRATDPGAVRSVLGNMPPAIIPGSARTTFQATGDRGLGSVERGYAARFPDQMAATTATQNNARVSAVQGVQSGGDPFDVAKYLKAQLDAADADHQGIVQNATTAAQGAASAIGGTANAETQGSAVRDALKAAADASAARYHAAYDAVDPNGDLVAHVGATKQAAADIKASMPSTAEDMTGKEAGAFQAAAAMNDTTSARDLMALRTRVSQAAAQARGEGDNISAARLGKLQTAIDANLADAVGQRVTSDQSAVSAGTLPAEQAIYAKMKAVAGDWQQQRVQARAGAGGSDQGNTGVGATSVPGVVGTTVPAGGGLGGAPGNPSLPSEPAPIFDAQAAERLKAANTQFAQHQTTFGVNPVGQVLKTDPYGRYVMSNGAVPDTVFRTGNSAYDGVQAALKAAPDSLPVLQDYAASTLRRMAETPEGTIDPAKFARWQKAYSGAIRALPPETQARFADAASAGDALGEATANRAAALKTAQQGVTGRVLGLGAPEDVTRTVGQVLNGRTAVADMDSLSKAVAGNPEAVQGLRQAVMDHILGRFMGNTEAATTGGTALKNDAFQTFVRQNRTALGKVFNPDELDTLDAVGADIRQSRRSQDAIKLPGSNTVQDKYSAEGTPGGKKGAHAPLLQILGAALGGSVGAGHGAAAGGEGGVVGMMAGNYLDTTLQGLKAKGIGRVDDLVREAVFNPEVARRLLSKVPTNGAGEVAPKALNVKMNGLIAALGANSASVSKGAQPPPAPHYNAFTPSAKTPLAITAPNAVTR